MKRSLLLLLFIIVCVVAITFYIQNSKKNVFKENALTVRKLDSTLSITKMVELPVSGCYKIQVVDNGIYILCNQNAIFLEKNNYKPHQSIFKESIGALIQKNDTTIVFDEKSKQIEYYFTNKVIKKINLENADFNVLLSKNEFYYATYGNKLEDDYVIRAVKKNANLFSVSKLLNKYLSGVDEYCKKYYTEGKLNIINDTVLIYCPYRTNLLIVFNTLSGKIHLTKTINQSPFINLKRIDVHINNSTVMSSCQPTDGIEFINRAISCNEKYILIVPNFIEAKSNRTINYFDFYDAHTFHYLFTKKIEFNKTDEYIVDIEMLENKLYFITSANNFYTAEI